MRVDSMFSIIKAEVKKGLDHCTSTIQGFCLYTHIVGDSSEHPEYFQTQLSTSDRPSYGSHQHPELLSSIKCWIQNDTYQGVIMLEVMPERVGTRIHPGEKQSSSWSSGSYNPYDQGWRHSRFLMAAEAHALWCLLEQNADMTAIVKSALTD